MAKLSRFLSKSEHEKAKSALSATAINDYINCSLKFYFSYVEGIKQTDELSEEVAENQFGSIFHYVMENIFKPFEGKMITNELLSDMQKDKAKIEKETRKGFSKYYYKNDQEIELKGNNYLIAQIILKYVIQLFDNIELIDEHILFIQPGTPLLISEVKETSLSSAVPAGMVRISAGSFTMNVTNGDEFISYPKEDYPKTVSVKSFYMDKYPVTNADFELFIQKNPSWAKNNKTQHIKYDVSRSSM